MGCRSFSNRLSIPGTFSEMDNAGISKEHWKIMLISGMGFFTDAYVEAVMAAAVAMGSPPTVARVAALAVSIP
jgi:hypothetical protein